MELSRLKDELAESTCKVAKSEEKLRQQMQLAKQLEN